MTQPKLLKLYNETLGEAAVEGLDADGMINAILTKQDEPAPPKEKKEKVAKGSFGNQDKDKKYDISGLKVPEDHYVVRHFNTVTLQNGQSMEDPTSSRFQVYDAETFNNYNTQHVKDGKQLPSTFQQLGLNVDVLHNPEKE